MIVDDDEFRMGFLLDPVQTAKLLRICELYEHTPIHVIHEAIDTMFSVVESEGESA